MELINVTLENLKELEKLPLEKMVTCLGEFDGIHIAHKQLFEETLNEGHTRKLLTSVITFYPHPDYVLNIRLEEGYLTPLQEKEKIIANMGFDYLIIMQFDKQLSSLVYVDFFDIVLKRFNMIVAGFDFSFGYRGQGKVEQLQKLHNNVKVIKCIEYQNKKIGSDIIRKYLLDGKLEEANFLLGRRYAIEGVVKSGSQIGRTINYPTANIQIDNGYFLFKNGVYGVYIYIRNKKYLGIANFGINPSFNVISSPRLEVYIFDFHNNIYDERVRVELIEWIRDERVFKDKQQLQIELVKNCAYVKEKYGG